MLSNWWHASEGTRSSIEEGGRPDAEDDTQIMEPDEGNVLSHIISQLRPGADLSRVVLPTFILEPRSMLERITNFMCHPEMLLHIPTIDDPTERFISVVKFYLSGWHIRPPGVKKPLNPVLGEVFTCYWDLESGRRAYYISEQTSHHPPKSSYFYMAPDYHIRIDGTLKPRSKFLGNSAASLMEGIAYLSFLNRGQDPSRGEQYIITQPNMYARGILFGKMKYELGDHSFVRCPELDLVADLEFKVKGWVGGTYNAIGGYIKRDSTKEVLYEISGLWSEEMFIKDLTTGQRELFFNASRAKPSSPQVRPIEQQSSIESQRLWAKTTAAVRERNHVVATEEKTKIEDRQRQKAASRVADGTEWHPRLFRAVDGGPRGPEHGEEDLEWIINADIDYSLPPEKQAEQIMAIYPVINGQQATEEHGEIHVSPVDGSPAAENNAPLDGSPVAENNAPIETISQADDNTRSREAFIVEAPINSAEAQPARTPDKIQRMLSKTGKPAEGPLLGLTEDLRKNLPAEGGTSTS